MLLKIIFIKPDTSKFPSPRGIRRSAGEGKCASIGQAVAQLSPRPSIRLACG